MIIVDNKGIDMYKTLFILSATFLASTLSLHTANETFVCTGSQCEAKNVIEPSKLLKLQKAFGGSPLHEAIIKGDLTTVRSLLAAGVNINLPSGAQSASPLHVATVTHQEKIADELLKHGANPNSRMSEDWTPLHIAACVGVPWIVMSLFAHGAKLDALTNKGLTPKQIAGSCNQDEMMVLLENPASYLQRVLRKSNEPAPN